jgi:Lrp/AsnC family leucine-responsive transcriptional regulator
LAREFKHAAFRPIAGSNCAHQQELLGFPGDSDRLMHRHQMPAPVTSSIIGHRTLSLDRKDIAILAELTENARASHTELSNRVGLSSTALARRQKTLEDNGYIKGYQAALDLARFGLGTTVLVRIALESQSDDALKKFEAEVTKCPSVVRCFLMSGTDDYILIVMARDIEDFERIHRTELSRLPRVARVQSSFALREVVNRAVPNVVFGDLRR